MVKRGREILIFHRLISLRFPHQAMTGSTLPTRMIERYDPALGFGRLFA